MGYNILFLGIFLIGIAYPVYAMDVPSIVRGTVVFKAAPKTLKWSAQLSTGESIWVSSTSKQRKTRHTNLDDMFKIYYSGRIDKKRIYDQEVQEWMKKLIKSSKNPGIPLRY